MARSARTSRVAAAASWLGASRRPARRWGCVAMMAAALGLGVASPAEAAPRDRPWGRGISVPSFGLGGGGFFDEIANVSFGLGFNYFIVNGLSAGLSFTDTILIYRSTIKAQYPGIEQGLPTNIFSITPRLQYVFFRSPRFSPYVSAGVGPVFFNHGGGTHGRWTGGPGVYINVVGPVYIDIGIGFSGMFPTDQCNDAWTYASPSSGTVAVDVCSFQWGPRIGPVLAFGGGRRSRERRREPPPEPPPYYEPVSNPLDESYEDETYESFEPAEPEPAEGAPTDVAPPPEGGTPTDVAPPPGDGAATDVAPPPADASSTDVASPDSAVTPPADEPVAPSPEGPEAAADPS